MHEKPFFNLWHHCHWGSRDRDCLNLLSTMWEEVLRTQTGKSRERCLQLGFITLWPLSLFSCRTTLLFPSPWSSPLSWNPFLVAQLDGPSLTPTLLSALLCTHILPVHRLRDHMERAYNVPEGHYGPALGTTAAMAQWNSLWWTQPPLLKTKCFFFDQYKFNWG